MNTELSRSRRTEAIKPKHSKALVVGLWVVAIYFFLTSGGTLFSYILLYSGALPLPPEQARYIESLTKSALIFAALPMVLNLVGAILLLLRRRSAFYVLAISAALNVSALGFNVITAGLPSGVSMIQAFLPYVFLVAVLLFVFILYRKNVLWH